MLVTLAQAVPVIIVVNAIVVVVGVVWSRRRAARMQAGAVLGKPMRNWMIFVGAAIVVQSTLIEIMIENVR